MSDECLATLQDLLPPETFEKDGQWRIVHLKPTILKLVNRTSSRAFLGEDLGRNEEWLRISATYTVNGMLSGPILHLCPSTLRAALNWISPIGAKCRRQVEAARRLINPIVEQRRALLGKIDNDFDGNDAIDWIEKSSMNNSMVYDAAAAQLGLSFAATHTSTDLVTQTVLDLATHADQTLFDALRNEIIAVISQGGGWTQEALEDMKLLDSVIKESLRLKPMFSGEFESIYAVSYGRLVTDSLCSYVSLTVSAFGEVAKNGLTVQGKDNGKFQVPPGTLMAVLDGNLDESIYENPCEWDGRRFYNMRRQASGDDGKDNAARLVCTSPHHSGFGIGGVHACPGRFFAAAIVKVVLCHLLMEFEWKLDGSVPKARATGMALTADAKARLLIRRRR